MTDIRERPCRPDQGRLRRFALAMGLLLVSYALAGISLEPNTAVNLFGIPFRLARPQLLPYVLVIASLYGLLRFYYYCFLAIRSPYSARRELLNRLVRHIKHKDGFSYVQFRSFGVYLGPIDFELGPQIPWMYKRDRKKGEGEPGREQPSAWAVTLDPHGNPVMPAEGVGFQKELEELFPAFAGARVMTRWNYESPEPPMQVRLFVVIPNRCRLAALLEDVDYSAPVWFNFLAVVVFVWSRWAA